jgi:hypothetical protein
VIEGSEQCDTGPLAATGCTDCQVDFDHACLREPSICAKSASVTWVPDDFATIDAAVDGSPDDTFVFVRGSVNDTQKIVVVDRRFTIVAEDGARLTGSTGSTLNLDGDSVVRVVGLHISNDDVGGSTDVVNLKGMASVTLEDCELGPSSGRGIDANGAVGEALSVVVRRCRIRDNATGGFETDFASYDIRHSFFFRNGTAGGDGVGSPFGAGYLTENNGVFAFNTVVDNRASDVRHAGMRCGESGTPLRHSIFFGNGGVGELHSTCDADNKQNLVDQAGIQGNLLPAGQQPGFAGDGDYHLGPGSAAIDAATGGFDAEDDLDIDLDERPIGSARDVGADEAF